MGWLRRFRIWLLLGTELFLKQPPRPRMAAGGARARQRAGRDQRSGSTGRTLAAVDVYARSVSFTVVSWRLHRPLFFILNEQAQRALRATWKGGKSPVPEDIEPTGANSAVLERDTHDLHGQERKMSSGGPRVAVGRTRTVIAKKEAALRRP